MSFNIKLTKTKKDIIYSIISLLFRSIGKFIIVFILARTFSLKNFGLFTYSLTLSGVLVLLFDYGYYIFLMQEIPKKNEKIHDLIGKALITKIVILFFLIFIFSIFDFNTVLSVSNNEIIIIKYFFIISLVVSFMNFFLIPFKAVGKYSIEALIYGVDGFLLILLVSAVNYLGMSKLINVVYIYLGVKTFVLFIIIYLYFLNFKIRLYKFNIIAELKKLFPYAVHFFIGGVYLSIDTLILKRYVSIEDVGIYQAGLRIIMGFSLFLTLINSVFLPKASSLLSSKKFYFFVSRVNSFVFLSSIIIVFFLLLTKNHLINFLYGQKFDKLSPLYYYISLTIFFRYIESVYGSILTIIGKQKIRALTVILQLIFIVGLDFIFVPKEGILVASMILFFVHVVSFLISFLFVYSFFRRPFLLFKIV